MDELRALESSTLGHAQAHKEVHCGLFVWPLLVKAREPGPLTGRISHVRKRQWLSTTTIDPKNCNISRRLITYHGNVPLSIKACGNVVNTTLPDACCYCLFDRTRSSPAM
jgi:hypothetical protein